jgi:hypothetical protein
MSNYVRADDFQRAWPIAYECAIVHTIELHQRMDTQLGLASHLISEVDRVGKTTHSELLQVAQFASSAIRQGGSESSAAILRATTGMEDKLAELIASDLKVRDEIRLERSRLKSERRAFDACVSAVRSSSLWQRLQFVLGLQNDLMETRK